MDDLWSNAWDDSNKPSNDKPQSSQLAWNTQPTLSWNVDEAPSWSDASESNVLDGHESTGNELELQPPSPTVSPVYDTATTEVLTNESLEPADFDTYGAFATDGQSSWLKTSPNESQAADEDIDIWKAGQDDRPEALYESSNAHNQRKLAQEIPPELLQSILDRWNEISNEIFPNLHTLWSVPPAATTSSESIQGFQFNDIGDVRSPLPLPPPIVFPTTLVYGHLQTAMKLSKTWGISNKSPLSHLNDIKLVHEWETFLTNESFLGDVLDSGVTLKDAVDAKGDAQSAAQQNTGWSFWRRKNRDIQNESSTFEVDKQKLPDENLSSSITQRTSPIPTNMPRDETKFGTGPQPAANPLTEPSYNYESDSWFNEELPTGNRQPAPPSTVSRLLQRLTRSNAEQSLPDQQGLVLSTSDNDLFSIETLQDKSTHSQSQLRDNFSNFFMTAGSDNGPSSMATLHPTRMSATEASGPVSGIASETVNNLHIASAPRTATTDLLTFEGEKFGMDDKMESQRFHAPASGNKRGSASPYNGSQQGFPLPYTAKRASDHRDGTTMLDPAVFASLQSPDKQSSIIRSSTYYRDSTDDKKTRPDVFLMQNDEASLANDNRSQSSLSFLPPPPAVPMKSNGLDLMNELLSFDQVDSPLPKIGSDKTHPYGQVSDMPATMQPPSNAVRTRKVNTVQSGHTTGLSAKDISFFEGL